MNKAELIEAVRVEAELKSTEAEQCVNAILDAITDSLSRGDSVSLREFGTFRAREIKSRTGHKPRTGEPIEIPAAKHPAFKPGQGLKDAVRS